MTETTAVQPVRRPLSGPYRTDSSDSPPTAAAPLDTAEALVRRLVVEQRREAIPDILPPLRPQAKEDMGPPARSRGEMRVAKWLDGKQPEQIVETVIKEMIVGQSAGGATAAQPGRFRRLKLPRPSLPRLGLPRLGLPRRNRAPATEASAPPRPPVVAGLRRFLPGRRPVVLAALALIVVMRPLLVGMAVLLVLWLALIAYLTIGPERCAEIAATAWGRLAERRPALAERIKRRATALAGRYGRFLAWLPRGWAERLALPEIADPTAGPKPDDRPDPFDRLAAQVRADAHGG